MRLVASVRTSTTDQSLSLAAQETAIRQWCAAMGHEIVEVIHDRGESGSTLDRPGLVRCLALLANGEADGLVVLKLDRLTRSVRDFCNLVERFSSMGWALVSVRDSLDTSSASGRLMANILVSFAEFERSVVSERTSAALQELKRQGVRLGPPIRPLHEGVEAGIRFHASSLSLAKNAERHQVSIAVVRRVLDRPR